MKLGYSPAVLAELERSAIGQPPPLHGEIRPGHVLDGRFAIIRVICHGGMSTILEAEDLENDRQPVALKVPMEKLGMDPKTCPALCAKRRSPAGWIIRT